VPRVQEATECRVGDERRVPAERTGPQLPEVQVTNREKWRVYAHDMLALQIRVLLDVSAALESLAPQKSL
jgi:hypothetical protein